MIIVTLELNCGANSLVTQLAPPSVSNENVPSPTPTPPTIKLSKTFIGFNCGCTYSILRVYLFYNPTLTSIILTPHAISR